MRSSIGIEVEAPAVLVFALARDVERWPRLLPHYERAEIVDRATDGSVVAVFVARGPLVPLVGLGLPVAWRSRVRADASRLRLRFHHLGGATDGMLVEWRLEERTGGCRVTIEHDFGPADSLLSRVRALAIDRFFVRPVATRTLATFRALAEATAEAAAWPTAVPTVAPHAPAEASRIRAADPERTERIGHSGPTAATRSGTR